MEGINPLLRKTLSYTAFCNYFNRFLNLLQLIRELQAKNTVEMGDSPESKRRTCSVEKMVKGEEAVFDCCDM